VSEAGASRDASIELESIRECRPPECTAHTKASTSTARTRCAQPRWSKPALSACGLRTGSRRPHRNRSHRRLPATRSATGHRRHLLSRTQKHGLARTESRAERALNRSRSGRSVRSLGGAAPARSRTAASACASAVARELLRQRAREHVVAIRCATDGASCRCRPPLLRFAAFHDLPVGPAGSFLASQHTIAAGCPFLE
jgi:hypothetical protein